MFAKNKEKTILVYTLEPWDHSLAYLRYRAPAEQLGWRLLQGRQGSTVNLDYIREADIVLIQRVFPHWYEHYQKIIENARMLQKPLLYEIDDLLIALPPEHPCIDWYMPTLEYILLGIMDADRVIVSSQLLAEIFAPFHQDIKVWPAYLPDSIWQPKRIRNASNDVVRVGYMGGMTHIPDLDTIAPVIQKLLDEYGNQIELHFWGCKPSIELNGNAIIHYLEEKINYLEFVDDFSSAQVDIWLAPLQDTIFNRCKSSIKFWEYSAIGGVGVFSRLPPYETVIRHGENGFLADSPEEWLQYIQFLIQNPEQRYQMAQQAQQTLFKEGLLSQNIQHWEQVFRTAFSKSPGRNTPFQQAFRRLVSQIKTRSDENERRIAQLIDEHRRLESQYVLLNQEHSRLHEYLRVLEIRSMQLDEIFRSRSWRLLQKINKLRRFDFSPSHYSPPPLPPDSEQILQPGNSLQDD